MNTKKVVDKMVKMTTRSGARDALDPDSSEQIESRPPAKPKDSTPEPSDRHKSLSKKVCLSTTLKKLKQIYFSMNKKTI